MNIGGSHNLVTKGKVNLTVHADEQQISQVLVNFVNNAIKYAPDSPEITITVEKMNLQEMKISVTDRGLGIPDEKKKHLFDRFYRADYSGIQFSGLGLGLYISTEIIKKHGGRIGADSKMGLPTCRFYFILPIRIPKIRWTTLVDVFLANPFNIYNLTGKVHALLEVMNWKQHFNRNPAPG